VPVCGFAAAAQIISTLYEAATDARFTQVNTRTKPVSNGADFRQITPMGQLPALEIDETTVLTENAAVLQYVADQFPSAAMAPPAIRRAPVCNSGSASSAPKFTKRSSSRCSIQAPTTP
jgi:glutathione S-transferase